MTTNSGCHPSAEGRPDPYVIPAKAGIQGRRGGSRTARKVSLREVLHQKDDEAISAMTHHP